MKQNLVLWKDEQNCKPSTKQPEEKRQMNKIRVKEESYFVEIQRINFDYLYSKKLKM
jgi:hypothetical protein